MRWPLVAERPQLRKEHERQWHGSVLAIDRSGRLATWSHNIHIALFGMLLLAVGCGSQGPVIVPSHQLSTFPVQSQSVRVETAAPFVEHIELREATLQFPTLRGVVSAFDAPWRIRVLQQPLTLDTRDGLRVEMLPALSSTAPIHAAAPQTGARVMVSSPGPFPSRIELGSATLVNNQLAGVVQAIDVSASSKAIGQLVALDVRKLLTVIVYPADTRGKVAGWVMLGIGGSLAVLGSALAIPSGTPPPYAGDVIAQTQIGFAVVAGIGGALALGGIVTLISAQSTR